MITKREIVENVLMAIRKTRDRDFGLMVDRFLQKHVFQISEQHSFHKLRQVIEIDLSDGWLPSNLAGIDAVKIGGRDLVRRDEAFIDRDERTMRFYSFVPPDAPLFVGEDLDLPSGEGFFFSANLDDRIASSDLDVVGQWVRFNTEYGFYKIIEDDGGQYKIDPVYHGQSLSQTHFEIRPRGTQKLVCVDHRGENATGTATVYYWTYHPPLHLDSDPLLFPHAGLVESIVIREAINNLGRRQLSSDKYIRDIDEAWRVTRRLNPSFHRQTGPRDRHNRIFSMNQKLFRQR